MWETSHWRNISPLSRYQMTCQQCTLESQWGGHMSNWSLLLIICFCPEPGVLCCGMDQNMAIRGPKLWKDGHCNSCNKRHMAAVNILNEYQTSWSYYKVKLSELYLVFSKKRWPVVQSDPMAYGVTYSYRYTLMWPSPSHFIEYPGGGWLPNLVLVH